MNIDSAIGLVTNLDLNMVLYIFGGIVGLYVLILIIAGLKGGLPAIGRIWFWTTKLWWLALIIIGFILILLANSRRGKKKGQIDADIAELQRIENKTNEDRRKLEALMVEKKKVEDEILATTQKYKEKLDKLKEKPDAPKPGDAGASSDALNDAWR
jgi:hypothetical protein